ncbi:MAG TPA: toll/interleukin-1 receptor domain-containing protein [Ktedonobacterales bacterium]|nr:toll/interleukin-1 receptor domain-containing protein [Ktedonobacterales bacterium]
MSASRPPDATRTPRIFVSHSHLDEAFALRLAGDFERAGAFVWIDKHDIKQGDFLKRINEGLAACDWLVLVETTDSLTSPAVEMEVNAALIRVLYLQMRGVLRFIAGSRDPRIVPALWAPLQYYDGTADFARATADTLDAIRDGDARWAATAPAPTTPSLPTSAMPAGHSSPLAALVADAYADNDWHAVSDASDMLLTDDPTAVTVAIWRMRGRALLELSQPARAVVALKAAYDLDLYDLPTVRLYARACLAVGAAREAELLLKRALALSKDPATKLDVLREYVPTLRALDHWDDALSRIDQALLLRPDDPGWQRQRLAALTHLNRAADALALAQQIATRPDATAADWLADATLTRATHPSPPDASDAETRAQIARALDAADRLATRTQPADPALTQAIAQARRTLLPPPPPRQTTRASPSASPN